MNVHACGLCNRFALFARRMGGLVEDLLEHHELHAGETFTCPTGGIVGGYARYRGCPRERGGLHDRRDRR